MDVILLETISGLGKVGEVVKVARGHARNYLFRLRKDKKTKKRLQPIALLLTEENKAMFAKQKEELEKRDTLLRQKAEELAKSLKDERNEGEKADKDAQDASLETQKSSKEVHDKAHEDVHQADMHLEIFCRTASDAGKLYAAIRPEHIIDAIIKKKSDILKPGDINPDAVQIPTAIREVGLFPAKVQLYPGVFISLAIHVLREGEKLHRVKN